MRGDHQTSSSFNVLSFRSLGEMGIQVGILGSDSSDPSGIRFPVVSRRPGARCVDRSLYDPLAAANVLF